MPYKDPIKRRECNTRWMIAHKNDPVKQVKDRARSLARQYIKLSKKCSVMGCKNMGERHHEDYTRPLDIVWLCNFHHDKLHKKVIICTTKGCREKHRARGLCHKHWMRKYRKPRLSEVLKLLKGG